MEASVEDLERLSVLGKHTTSTMSKNRFKAES